MMSMALSSPFIQVWIDLVCQSQLTSKSDLNAQSDGCEEI